MHPHTVATLNQLEKAEWFASVGVKDTEAAIVLSSWQEAVEHCASVEWGNLLLEAANQYRERLLERSKERFIKWNEIVDEVKPVTTTLVRRKVKAVCARHDLPRVFVDTVEWDILHLCMEAEYADVYPPGFYASQAYWYIQGHFPCGWQGEFPDGKLIIF
jgi:hypothetical protein